MSDEYRDSKIEVSDQGLTVRWYYLPFGSKRIQFEKVRSIRRVNMGVITGRGRIWGTANPGYWSHLDPKRPTKRIAYLVDTGHPVRAFLTPDDPAAFERALEAHSSLQVKHGGRSVFI